VVRVCWLLEAAFRPAYATGLGCSLSFDLLQVIRDQLANYFAHVLPRHSSLYLQSRVKFIRKINGQTLHNVIISVFNETHNTE